MIHTQRIAELPEQSGHGAVADRDAAHGELLRNAVRCCARPQAAADRAARRAVCHQRHDQLEESGVFFSARLRPPPGRRIRVGSSPPASSWRRPAPTVSADSPRLAAAARSPP